MYIINVLTLYVHVQVMTFDNAIPVVLFLCGWPEWQRQVERDRCSFVRVRPARQGHPSGQGVRQNICTFRMHRPLHVVGSCSLMAKKTLTCFLTPHASRTQLSELIHNSENFPDLQYCKVSIYFCEIIDKVCSAHGNARLERMQPAPNARTTLYLDSP